MKHSLLKRCIYLVLLIVLPIVFFIIFLSRYILNNYRQEILNLYEFQTEEQVQLLQSEFANTEKKIISLTSEQRSIFYLTDGVEKDLSIYQMSKQMTELCTNDRFVALVYLKTPDERVYISYDHNTYDFHLEMEAKKYIASCNLSYSNFYSPEMLELAEECFLLQNVAYHGYSMGVLIDINQLLQNIAVEIAEKSFHTYLVIRDEIYAYDDAEIFYESSGAEYNKEYDQNNGRLYEYEIGKGIAEIEILLPNVKDIYDTPLFIMMLQMASFGSLILVPLFIYLLYSGIVKPIKTVSSALLHLEEDDLDYRIHNRNDIDEFQYLYNAYNKMADHLKYLTKDVYEKEVEKLRLSILNAKLQTNPHMVLNLLNTIHAFALTGENKSIIDCTENLTDYLRYVLRRKTGLVTIQEEIDFILSFVELQTIRFPDRFTFVYDIEDDILEVEIPPFIIENFVENSIKYAINPESEIEIMIVARRAGNTLNISITDTGNGMDENCLLKLNNGEIIEDITGRHIGIWNVRQRLKLYYGMDAMLTFSSEPGEGTQVWMSLPVNQLVPNAEEWSNIGVQKNESINR